MPSNREVRSYQAFCKDMAGVGVSFCRGPSTALNFPFGFREGSSEPRFMRWCLACFWGASVREADGKQLVSGVPPNGDKNHVFGS